MKRATFRRLLLIASSASLFSVPALALAATARLDKQSQTPATAGATSVSPTPSRIVCTDIVEAKGRPCDEQEYAKHGLPLFSDANEGVALGVSLDPANSAKISVWMDNQTDTSKAYLMCCRSTYTSMIRIFDSTGRRVLGNSEQSLLASCSRGDRTVSVCTCSGWIVVAPHTMQVIDGGDLGEDYTLPPGQYRVYAAYWNHQECDSLQKAANATLPVKTLTLAFAK